MRSFFNSLLLIGLVTLIAGFMYDVEMVGLPYPDPTPEQSRAQAVAELRGSSVMFTGLAQFSIGIFGWVTFRLLNRNKPHTPVS